MIMLHNCFIVFILYMLNIKRPKLLSCVPPSGNHVLYITDTLHLLGGELPGAEAVLAPGGGQHLLEQHVRALHAVGGQHLPPVRSQLLEKNTVNEFLTQAALINLELFSHLKLSL